MTTPESFVPLTAAAVPPAAREFRVAVVSPHDHSGPAAGGGQPAPPAGFQSLETQRLSAMQGAGAAGKKMSEPRVTIQRDGDRITHLRIQCTCGQIMDLACAYEDAPPKPK